MASFKPASSFEARTTGRKGGGSGTMEEKEVAPAQGRKEGGASTRERRQRPHQPPGKEVIRLICTSKINNPRSGVSIAKAQHNSVSYGCSPSFVAAENCSLTKGCYDGCSLCEMTNMPATIIGERSRASRCKASQSQRHQGSQQASKLPYVVDRWVPMAVVTVMTVSGTVTHDKVGPSYP
uniref:Uncharacterized protein n=2 Tax=Oryza sativa subsp. japonica TaxID=39947 RepID=Q6F2G9_ORYSJ|nr:hypothetical protein [Oryza sativa Japonica Group]ABF97278.1 hypothetical protein LOC_Os03g38190 [Oryza sativa Japonica Group]